MCTRGESRVRKLTRQKIHDNGSSRGTCSAQPADGSDRIAVEEIGREHVGDGGKGGVGESSKARFPRSEATLEDHASGGEPCLGSPAHSCR